MISDLAILIELISKYGPWGIVLIIVVYLLRAISDEDLSAAWRARIYYVKYKISRKGEAEKKYIQNDISSRINLARRDMPFGKETLPKAIKIEWVGDQKEEVSYIKENEIIIRLDPAELQEKNIILLTSALVRRTCLVGIRHILSEPLELSMDLNLVKNLLIEIGDRRILDWFFRNEYQPNIDKSDQLREWNSKIVEIDERGLFTRLLLVELDDYSKRVIGKPANPQMFSEISGLVDFLFKISTKAYGYDAPLNYTSQNIRIGVILVGETSKVILSGVGPYLTAFAYNLQRQLSSIYMIKWDRELLGALDSEAFEEFSKMTERLDETIKKLFRISTDFELKYTCIDSKGNKRKGNITRYIPKYV